VKGSRDWKPYDGAVTILTCVLECFLIFCCPFTAPIQFPGSTLCVHCGVRVRASGFIFPRGTGKQERTPADGRGNHLGMKDCGTVIVVSERGYRLILPRGLIPWVESPAQKQQRKQTVPCAM
jgi:hypothetical protein